MPETGFGAGIPTTQPQLTASTARAGIASDPILPFDPGARDPHLRELPVRLTSFVGRQLELTELAQLLAAPDCRLLTIIGPGGIGKTRLAIEAAEMVGGLFANGIAFVPLQALGSAEKIAPAIAYAVGCTLSSSDDERVQVARFLRETRILLIIDNVEHLLTDATWLSELLAESPGVRILATSREALNLREEWRYPLAGLALPDDSIDSPKLSDAVLLFVERARQLRPEFEFETEYDAVVRLCRIAEGLPLALELAAAWVTTLPCADIADEIERNIAFLATNLRNVPARHRSMLAAFDHSWTMLTEDEQCTFRRLAVFRGGFSRDAAEQIAGASLPLMSSLVGKSLVRRDTSGRFQLHELLRQYAGEHLRSLLDETERTVTAHREYYLSFVEARFDAIVGGAQREAVAEIASELDNIRAAWQTAILAGDAEAIGRVAHTLTLFFDLSARYVEGTTLLEEGLSVLRAAPPSAQTTRLLTDLLVDVVRMNHRRGRLSDMRTVLAEVEDRYLNRADPPPQGMMTDPGLWRALLTLIDGEYAAAAQLGADGVRRNMANNRLGNVPLGWWVQAAANLWQEQLDVADECARQCSQAALSIEDRWELAYCYNIQGHIATAREDFAEARQHYEASYAIREKLNDPVGMSTGLTHLAKIAALQGATEEAEQWYLRSLAIAREIGDQITTASALNGLGMLACAAGNYATAGRYLAEGLQRMTEAQMVRRLLTFLTSAGDWLLQTGQASEAAAPLALAHAHPGSDRETRARAERLLADVALALSHEDYAATIERTQGTDPASLATQLIPLLTASPAADLLVSSSPESPTRVAATKLVEPLTDREMSVLQLIAVGHSNRQIADELFLSVNTVRSYSQQIYGKLGVGSRTQAVARARELDVLP